jgi:cysteine-rich repeat protein
MSMRRVFPVGLLVGALVAVGGCASGGAVTSGDCGNARLDPGEQCDGQNLGGFTCETLPGLEFTGGQLLCTAGCSMDTSACTGGSGLCGNGVIDATEICDGADLGGETCESQGMVAGTLACMADCRGFNMTGCTISETCDNGVRDGLEECDGTDLAGATCEILGYLGGTLDCQANCLFDESGCSNGTCGNGVIEGSEECDGLDLGGESCVSRGYGGGALACSASCTFDETLCGASTCGDGVVDAGEDCDGTDLNGADCASEGFTGGDLACDLSCVFDTTGCTAATCGNGAVEAGEECDGSDFGGEDCTSQGFGGGSLACTATCTIDTSGCTSASCGNSVVEAGEECDDGNTTGGDGCSATCTWENLCTADETIGCNSSDYMSSVSGNDSDNYSCSTLGGNADRIYALTIPAGTTSVTASLTCDDWDDDYDLFILEGACNGSLCIDYGTSSSCDSVSFNVTAGLTYYIVVEDYSTWMGVTLNVSCN